MTRELRLIPLLALLATAGCDSIFGSSERELRRESILSYHNEPVSVTVPATASVGVPFQVAVRSYGPGCYSIGGTNVVEVPDGAQVLPYDFLRVNGSDPCPQGLQTFEHTAQVTFGAAGTYTVTVLGVSVQSTGASRIRVERTVEVE